MAQYPLIHGVNTVAKKRTKWHIYWDATYVVFKVNRQLNRTALADVTDR